MDRNVGQPENEYFQGLNGPDAKAYAYSNIISPGFQGASSFSWQLPTVNGYYERTHTSGSQSINSIQQVLHPLHLKPSFVPVSGTRVHINPNFRPKPSGCSEKDLGTHKTASVHINPHWKRKSELISSIEPNEFIASQSVGRKTIFVNPKMLGHMQPTTACGSDLLTSLPKLRPPVQVVEHSQSACQGVKQSPSYNTPTLRSISEADTLECASKPSIVSNPAENLLRRSPCSKELLLKDNRFVCNSISDIRNLLPSNFCHKSYANLQPSPSIVSSKLKVAKQIRSKYKFVRNTSKQLSNSSPVKIASANTFRRVRKKSLSLKSTNAMFPKSFKHVEECNRSITKLSSRYKLVNRSEACLRQNPINQLSSKVVQAQRLKKNNVGNKVVKTRFKLVKMSSLPLLVKRVVPATNEGRLRKVNSRFKLVQVNPTGMPPKPKNSTLCKVLPSVHVPSASLAQKSHFKLVRYSSQGINTSLRKVSRYRIIQDNGSKIKIRIQPSPLKWTKNYHRGSLPQASEVKKSWPYFYGNRIWQSRRLLQPSVPIRNKYKLLRLNSGSPKQWSSSRVTTVRSGSNVLSIGGVLYRSTPTSLTRAQPCGTSERVLHIRGRKFALDSKGTTLRLMVDSHVSNLSSSQAPFSRIDIGGVTFVPRIGNTFVRTNTHYTRSLLSFAKMKSIALLTAKLRKNNQPCLIYNRFGKCLAHEKGKCWRAHNPNNISICQKFLQGCCDIGGCLLSHNVGPEKMPTCKYFLDGCCVRDNCPYLHVKLSARAGICRQFLDGYCASGDMCKKRHVNICPSFDHDGKCLRGKYCPYPHPKIRKAKIRNKKPSSSTSTLKENTNQKLLLKSSSKGDEISIKTIAKCNAVGKRKRYYDESKPAVAKLPVKDESYTTTLREKRHRILKQIDHLKKMRQGLLVMDDINASDSSDSEVHEEELYNALDTRPKIGILPAYIPLD